MPMPLGWGSVVLEATLDESILQSRAEPLREFGKGLIASQMLNLHQVLHAAFRRRGLQLKALDLSADFLLLVL